MAANDYYTTSHPPTGQQHPSAAPGTHSTQSISPVSSPFDDNHYQYPSNSNSQAHLVGTTYSNTAYSGASDTQYNSASNRYDSPSTHQHNTDPFADQNAIPMTNHGKKAGVTRYNTDPEQFPQRHPGHEKMKKKKGWFSGRVTWFVYIMTTVQIVVFIAELIRNGMLTGTPIQLKPSFNIMIGPSPYVLINMGARYPPCMHNVDNVTDLPEPIRWPCPNTVSLDEKTGQVTCTLAELCGMGGGVPPQIPGTEVKNRDHEPNQWWRFITPIFMHAGIIHIAFNMLLQLTLGRDMEKEMGIIRFALVYFSSGIFGFVLGSNYAAPNIPSVGASGSLFGILALVLLDLLYNWGSRRSPMKDLLFLLLDVAIAFVLGLLPGLDNFSHIGGFLMGLVLGICLLHSPQPLRERIGVDEPPYTTVNTAPASAVPGIAGMQQFVKQPMGFFKGRKPLWWAWWFVRAGALLAVFVGFIMLLRNFYEWRNKCSWCHRLTCLPVTVSNISWCDIGNFHLQNASNATQNPAGNANNPRGLAPIDLAAFMSELVLPN
ncbi:rhomboid family membrane protein-like protein [Massariosphaeria phaeospora]|uniref:Rhomboid-type serine protease n=1 Tax=Massariosphaeria phaeospora TaxID=100035 RepID=A0A7C8I486_9PLEO|nr:rhomboid family membrane protein-like protein [Massariosphaeria phaeospora]